MLLLPTPAGFLTITDCSHRVCVTLPPITAMRVALVSALSNNLTIHAPSIIEFHWFLSSPVPQGKGVFYCIRDAPVGKKVASILVHSYIHRTCCWLQLFVCWGFFFISTVSFDALDRITALNFTVLPFDFHWTMTREAASILFFSPLHIIFLIFIQSILSLKLEVILPSN